MWCVEGEGKGGKRIEINRYAQPNFGGLGGSKDVSHMDCKFSLFYVFLFRSVFIGGGGGFEDGVCILFLGY